MRIKPATGLKVRDHVTRQLLPEDGIDIEATNGVPNDPYWQRLLRDKDVVLDEPLQEAAALAPPVEPHSDAESGS